MTTFTLEYESKEQLKNFISVNNCSSYKSILVQVFTSNNQIDFSKELIQNILELIPDAKIIGGINWW